MFAVCECGYDSGNYESIHILKEIINSDGGDYEENICPSCKDYSLVT